MARRRFGQHFLVDRRAPGRIVRALAVERGDPVVEIGPGRGVLTRLLIDTAGKVLAIEVDRDLAAGLREKYDPTELVLAVGDVLRLDLGEMLAQAGFPDRGLLLVGNLPYNISKPIVQRIVRERERVDRAVLMFQREVAARLTAAPGSRAYGPMTVLARLCFDIEVLFDLPPTAFVPRPKVDSTVTRWRRRRDFLLAEDLERRLRGALAACFLRRRRTLRNNLRQALASDSSADRLLRLAGLCGSRRPETLSPEEFVGLAGVYEA